MAYSHFVVFVMDTLWATGTLPSVGVVVSFPPSRHPRHRLDNCGVGCVVPFRLDSHYHVIKLRARDWQSLLAHDRVDFIESTPPRPLTAGGPP